MAAPEQEVPVEQEMYCPECGAAISRKAEICPECGVRVQDGPRQVGESKTRLGKKGYIITGIVSGLVAFLLLPVVLGPISIFCGFQLFRHHDERWGIGIMVLGGAGLVLGAIIGMLAWTS